MDHLSPHDVMVVFLALAALLASAKCAGELVKKFNQPSVRGEIIAGILLGPRFSDTTNPLTDEISP
jgi:Kef-type K+ transport system membrane component KefB